MTDSVQQDNHFFSAWANSWWDNDSMMNPLKSFNPLRFAYFDRYMPSGWKGVRILDVGCGGGYTTEFLHGRGAQVSGVDVSPKLVEAATRHAAETGKEIEYKVGAAEALPFDDATFDVVTCVDVLEHVKSPADSVREIHRVLKPGGIFLYDTINRTMRSRVMMIWLPERVLGIVPKGAHDWADFITPQEMDNYLRATGFTPIGAPQGIAIRGQNKDGSLKAKLTSDTSALYLGVARK
ncbi:bifunctional 2-polyprenyl-6-hydroxyphenol methylase/3-demethylubiquinol 3-O-methyltransferase UbiG [Nocardia cyriacigeorgica]|uniref:3-demethylubiquinone-9 3-methyltransferase n=1 Tax=Nocardia cyriacigeorgica TaxID=135487 RepID=A0A4U8WBA7_9NOCA|nr:bifunctional 2-polyprenyl-6-hydroxyphenol methylase/3-demethylubiquinol 3-O-methyltransferase UbiG [Nocardia cyriacigeorgica]MBF6101676.1 3-demethylubiquinone-9 3-O-methyltransferase [Nocardia cyriacigeorgica]MBF6158935.1 3-demethylubiquinone-9 3-O-methyltransferase [Nocardia cyriacigeorgica]MBF6197379.1 3-demethylubiquinone-9 3-O-methyltransferase [Nocardia cyriacigeorgica]MBF6344371.1 3-demethylubiquinone-9 3-O-methyltransferase [Nocardia cyriacigeorgica]VFA99048.1 3-demethylubiquinone-9 